MNNAAEDAEAYNDYVHHMTKKYRLAVAIAVIKSKPKNLTDEEYIQILRNKINTQYETEVGDLENSICSDDFEFNNDDNFMDIDNDDNEKIKVDHVEQALPSCKVENQNNILENLSQKHVDYNLATENADAQPMEQNTSLKDGGQILDVVESRNDLNDDTPAIETVNTISGTIQLLKALDKMNTDHEITDFSQSTFCGTQSQNILGSQQMLYNSITDVATHTITRNANDFQNQTNDLSLSKYQAALDMTYCETETNVSKNFEGVIVHEDRYTNNVQDTQSTEIYSVHGVTQNNTYVSQTQGVEAFHISKKYLISDYSDSKNKTENYSLLNENEMEIETNSGFQLKRHANLESESNYETPHYSATTEKVEDIDLGAHSLNPQIEYAQNFENHPNTNSNSDRTLSNVESTKNYKNETDAIFHNGKWYTLSDNNKNTKKDYATDVNMSNSGTHLEKRSMISFDNSNINTNLNNNKNIDQESSNQASQQSVQTNCINEKNSAQYNTDNVIKKNNNKDDFKTTFDDNVETNDLLDSDETDIEEPTEIIIPFKVVEELNKVKSYLNTNRKNLNDDCSMESSGYKSDSQRKPSLITASQLSSQATWLNQSAHTLFKFIVTCPLVEATDDINAEISQALGQLIDKLHEDENYLSFFEDLLQSIQSMLKDLFEGERTVDILQKEDVIERIILLNKSIHIIKYTIGKINIILEHAHSKLTSEEEIYELTNISEVENLTYVFHTLEMLLKRYMKKKNIQTSQSSTQNTQEDTVLKRSTIADIWRKKWDPDYKEHVEIEEKTEEKCVETKCREILNRIVVDGMKNYSLFSFAALQCSNLFQS